jgi:hypothetical protein
MMLLAATAMAQSQREELQANSGYNADGSYNSVDKAHMDLQRRLDKDPYCSGGSCKKAMKNYWSQRAYGSFSPTYQAQLYAGKSSGDWTGNSVGSNAPGKGDPGGAPNKGDCNCGR